MGHPLAFQSRRLKNAILTQNKLFKNLHHYFYKTVCTIWNWPIEAIQLAILDIWNYPEHQSIIFVFAGSILKSVSYIISYSLFFLDFIFKTAKSVYHKLEENSYWEITISTKIQKSWLIKLRSSSLTHKSIYIWYRVYIKDYKNIKISINTYPSCVCNNKRKI